MPKMWNIDDTLEYSAEVLYVDSRIAILKGHVMDEPSKSLADWGYFYVDFKKLDREAYMSEYNKDFTTWDDKE